jgi:long-chain acyl-CoA synthetase
MDKIWLKHYPPGVPAEIDFGQYRSIGDLFEKCAAAYRERPAFHSMGRTMRYGELERQSRAFGAWLQSRGLAKGARVALMMPNVLQYPPSIFGTLLAGCIVVNVNPLYTPRELGHQLRDAGAEAIVILENFAHVLQQVVAKTAIRHVVVASLGDLLGLKGLLVNYAVRNVRKMVPAWHIDGAVRYNTMLKEGARATLQPVPVDHDDVAFLQYTGGTTGVSKGATLLHRNILANLAQSDAWMKPFKDESEPQVAITALPLYHIFSLTANCLNMVRQGGSNVLIVNPRDIPAFVRELAKHRFTLITGVNTLFNALLNHPDFVRIDFSRLRISLGGGMAVQKAVADRWKQVTGSTLVEAYGLSETSPGATTNPLDLKDYNGSIGLPLPSTEIMIRGDDGQPVPPGEPGEICIRGPQVMQGYWQRPEETARAISPDGFFATGDVGMMDDAGYVRIVDRKKDMILVSGFNVYPNEIEAVVAMHPGVLECAVVGVPDAHSGEAVKLFVVKKDPALTEAALRSHCERNLTGYKRPRQIEFRSELPKTNVGKMLRRALREQAA